MTQRRDTGTSFMGDDDYYGDVANNGLGFEVPNGFGTDRRHSIGAITEQYEDGRYKQPDSDMQMV